MIIVYSKNNCAYCGMAKNFLRARNIMFQEINIDHDADAREFMIHQGHKTMPQIYVDGRLFVEGGWTGLSKMSAQDIIGELELRDALSNQTL